MTDKNTVEPTGQLDDAWFSTPRVKVPSTDGLQQRIIQQAQSIEQQVRQPVSHHQPWYTKWQQLSWRIVVPAGLTASVALIALMSFQPASVVNPSNPITVNDSVSEAEWQDYFLLEDEVLLSSL